MNAVEVAKLKPGLYRIWWSKGGETVALVGGGTGGWPVFTAVDWLNGTPSSNWDLISRCEPVEAPRRRPELPVASLDTAGQMALAVLRGEMDTARMLADLLLENTPHDAVRLPPVKKITVDWDRLRVLVWLRDDTVVDDVSVSDITSGIRNWFNDGETLVLTGVERVELYEMPARDVPLGVVTPSASQQPR